MEHKNCAKNTDLQIEYVEYSARQTTVEATGSNPAKSTHDTATIGVLNTTKTTRRLLSHLCGNKLRRSPLGSFLRYTKVSGLNTAPVRRLTPTVKYPKLDSIN